MNPQEIDLYTILQDLVDQEDGAPFTQPLDLGRVRAALQERDRIEAEQAAYFTLYQAS